MQHEGPWFRGTAPFKAKPTDEPLFKLVGVTTSTEGGCFDSANGYDSAVISLGLIQIIPVAGLGGLLKKIFEQVGEDQLQMVRSWEARFGIDLIAEISRLPNPNLALRLYGCSGRKGSWSGTCWERAEQLFQAVCPILALPQAQQIQLHHVSSRILTWVMPDTQKILFQELQGTGWLGALQAAVTSFSANNPMIADRHFRRYVDKEGPPQDTRSYVIGAIDAMTYGPNIAIYPARKAAIRPEIERLYGVSFGEEKTPARAAMDPSDVQRILIRLGYDLGPSGADGKFGSLSRMALAEFQRSRKLVADGILGPKTLAELAKERDES